MNKLELTIGTVISLVITGAALAHGGATGVVKERMDGMMAMGDAVKSLSAMMRGEEDYDAAAVKMHGQTIETHAGDALVGLFPKGSDGASSEAKPAIWTDSANFEALASQLETYAIALQVAADNGPMMEDSTQRNMMGGSGMMSSSDMMNGSGMMGDQTMMSPDALAKMPVDGVFNMLVQTCASCHAKYRSEK